MNDVTSEVCVFLRAFGFNPYVNRYTTKNGTSISDVSFTVDNGSESLYQRYKDAISMLVKGYLMEFYYQGNTQHVRLYETPVGLDRDNDRYSCLIKEMIHVQDDKPAVSEMFINMGDHFNRMVQYEIKHV